MEKQQDVNISNDDLARAKLEEARSIQNRSQKYELLKDALGAAEEATLQTDIQKELADLFIAMKPSVAVYLQHLKIKDEYDQFIIALRLLEGLDTDGYPFSVPEKVLIQSARAWFNEKRTREGARVSRVMLGGLTDKYIGFQNITAVSKPEDYYVVDDQKYTYDQYLSLFKREWFNESKNVCDKILHDAHETAIASPSGARARLQSILITEIDKKVDGEDRVIKIKEYPFADPEIEKIKSYIGSLNKACEQEGIADDLHNQAINAVTPYARYELLLKSRDHSWLIPGIEGAENDGPFILPGLDNDIHAIYDTAIEFRCNQIKESIAAIQDEIKHIPDLGKNIIENQFARIETQIDAVYSGTIAWPGDGQTLNVSIDEKNISYPIKLPESLKSLGKECQELKKEFSELKSTYGLLKEADKSIRQLLENSDEGKIQEGVQAFEKLRRNEIIVKFQIFEALEDFKVQQTSFEVGERDILKHYNDENWSTVLRLCKEFELKPNYRTKCRKEIKENILLWKRTADHKLKLQKLQDLYEKGNYLGAKRVWERAQKDKGIDWQSVNFYIEKIKDIESEGKPVWEFYKQTLSVFGLYPHVLLDILQDPDETLDRLEQLDSNDAKIVKTILGESKGQFSGEQIDANIVNYLTALLEKTSFEQKSELLEKINHVAGRVSALELGWPSGSSSFAQYEARILARYLTALVRQDVISGLKNAEDSKKESEILGTGSKILAVYKFGLSLSDEERNSLKTVEISNAQIQSVASSPEQSLRIWEEVKRHFENDTQVLVKYSEAKRAWYLSEIKKLRAKTQFNEALQLISKGFDDENVGTIWQLYLEKAYTCLDMKKFEDARKALTEVVRKFKKTSELAKIEVDIDLEERSAQYRNEPLAFMSSVLEYLKIVDKKYTGYVEQALHKGYETYSHQYIVELHKKINSDREKAWRPLLDLMKLEEIYAQVNPKVKRASNDFIEQLIPTLYPMGLSLIKEAEDFNEKTMNHGVALKKCLAEGERIFDRLVSYESLLSSMYSGKEDQLRLDAVLRDVINKSVRDQRKKEFLRELDDYTKNEDGNQRYYYEIQTNRSQIRQNLDLRLNNCEKKLISATDAVAWLECAQTVMLGLQNSEPWKPLDAFSGNLKDYKNFQEVRQFQDALQAWKSTLVAIHAEYAALREQFADEDFDGSEKSVLTLEKYFVDLPAFSDVHTCKDVVIQLKARLTAQNSYSKDDLNGLDAIGRSVAELKSEINSWNKEKDKQQNEVDEINQNLRDLQDKVSEFKRNYYTKHQSYFKTTDARRYLDDYLNSVTKLSLLNRGNTASGLPRPSIIPDTTSSLPSTSDQSANNREFAPQGFFERLFGRKTASFNPLLEGIKSSAKTTYPISEQKLEIGAVLNEIRSMAKNDHISLTVKSRKSEDLKRTCDALMLQKKKWESELVGLCDKLLACQAKIPYPQNGELQSYYRKNQYSNMARRIIESDLMGTAEQNDRDEVNAFREILMKVKWI